MVLKAKVFPTRLGNRLKLLKKGACFFPAALEAIQLAEHEVCLETYIFADDAVGHQFALALQQAAQRGVDVRLVLDGFGAAEGIARFVPELRDSGVKVRVFRPERFVWEWGRNRLRRLHRKLLVVDRRVAFVGGINVIDDLNHEQSWQEFSMSVFSDGVMRNNALGPRYDFAVRVEGPLVQDVWFAMHGLWVKIRPAGQVFEGWFSREMPQLGKQNTWPLAQEAGGAAQLLLRDNVRFRRRIESAYVLALSKAKESVLIANAYFLPSRRLRKSILAAARRGVRVRLLLQGQVEYRFQHYATQHLYGELLAAGVEVYEYLPSFLHAKVAVVDTHWATVGSSNLDPLSTVLAREANLVVFDHNFAAALEQELEQAMLHDAQRVQKDAHQNNAWHWRALRYWCYRLVLLGVLLAGGASRY